MRISASILPPAPSAANPLRRDLLVEAAAAVSGRYPDGQPRSRPPVERILEGEILPRPAAEPLPLTDYRATLLKARATTLPPAPTAPAAAATATGSALLPASVLFYLLHSSTANLAGPLGRNVDQRV